MKDVIHIKLVKTSKRRYLLIGPNGNYISHPQWFDTDEDAKDWARRYCQTWTDFVIDEEIQDDTQRKGS